MINFNKRTTKNDQLQQKDRQKKLTQGDTRSGNDCSFGQKLGYQIEDKEGKKTTLYFERKWIVLADDDS